MKTIATHTKKNTVTMTESFMKKKYIKIVWALLLIFAFGNTIVVGQSTASYGVGTNTTGSLATDFNGNTVDMTTGTTSLVAASSDDTQSSLTSVGFDFWLMGTRYTQFGVTDNGMLTLGVVPASGLYVLPNSTTPTISAFANDLRVGTDGIVKSKMVGTAPNRCLVVEWTNAMIRYLSTAAAGTGTFQARIYETTGIIEFMYGTMATNTAGTTSYYVGFSTNTTTNNVITINTTANSFTTSSTVNSNTYSASSTITQLSSASNGSRRFYRFTPTSSTSPSGLGFSAISTTGMTLTWTDNSADETGFAIYQSTDGGVTYTYNSSTAANVATKAISGLTAGTTYFWKVYAIKEALSTSTASGSQATTTIYTSVAAADWNIASTWSPAVIPPAGSTVIINTNVSAAAGINQITSLTVNSGFTLTLNSAYTNTSTSTITVNSGGTFAMGATLTNTGTSNINGSFQLNQGGYANSANLVYGASGTLIFNNTSGPYGVGNDGTFGNCAYWPTASGPANVTVQNGGGISMGFARTVPFSGTTGTFLLVTGTNAVQGTALTLNGTAQINGGNFQTTPTYGAASTLVYATNSTSGSPYGVNNEWTGSASAVGSGIPNNVTVQGTTFITMPNGNRGLAGICTINVNNGMTLNATAGDLAMGGNFVQNGTLTNSGRAVNFFGSAVQTITGTGLNGTGGTNCFAYLQNSNTSGGVTLGVNATIDNNTNQPLQLLAASPLTIGAFTLTLNGNGGSILVSGGTRVINFTSASGILLIKGTAGSTSKTVTTASGGLLSVTSTTAGGQVQVQAGGLDCGSGLTTIQTGAFLTINSQGYITGNSATYASGSTLSFRTGGAYGVGNLDKTWAIGASGAGVPDKVEINAASTNVQITENRTATTSVTVTSGTLTSSTGGVTLSIATGITSAATALNINGGTVTNGGGTITTGATNGGNQALSMSLGALNLSSGTINLNGNYAETGGLFTQSGGNLYIDGNSGTSSGTPGSAATSVASGTSMFFVSSLTGTGLNCTAGTIRIVDPPFSTYATSSTRSVSLSYSTSAPSAYQFSGTHTFEFGDGSSSTAGNTDGFIIECFPGSYVIPVNNVLVNAGNTNSGRWVSAGYSGSAYATAIQGNLTINANGEFRNSLAAEPFYLNGNLTNNGTFSSAQLLTFAGIGATGSSTAIAATAGQTISGTGTWRNSTTASTASFAAVTTNNTSAAGITLGALTNPLNISGVFTNTAGLIFLGSNSFTFITGSTIFTGSVTQMFVINGTGLCKRAIATGAASYTFPIGENTGTTEYSPVTLTFTANSIARTVGAKVIDANDPNLNTPSAPTNYLSRYWTFSESGAGGTYNYYINPAVAITGASDENGTASSIKAAYWNGSVWTLSTGSYTSGSLISNATGVSETLAPLGTVEWTGRETPPISYTWVGFTDGTWATAANWSPSGVPAVSDNVTLANGSTGALANLSLTGSVSVNNITFNGSGTFFTIGAAASLSAAGNITYTAGTGTWNATSTFVISSVSSQTIPAFTYGNLTASNGPRVWTSGTTGIAGTFTAGAGTYTATSGSTVDYTGAGAQSIAGVNYYNLTNSGNGARTLAGTTIDIANTYTPTTATTTPGAVTINFSSAGTQTIPTSNYYVFTNTGAGPRTLASSGANSNTITMSSGFSTGAGAFTTTGSTMEFTGTGTGSLSLFPYYNLKLNSSGTVVWSLASGITLAVANDLTITSTAGTSSTLNVANNAGVSNILSVSGSVNVLDKGVLAIQSVSSATGTANITGNLSVSGIGMIKLNSTSAASGSGIINVTGNFTSTATGTGSSGPVDFGSGTITNNAINIAGNFSKSGVGTFYTSSGSPSAGFVFNKNGTQTFNYSGANSDYTSYTVGSTSTLQMQTGLVLSVQTAPYSNFIVNGILDVQTNVISGGSSTVIALNKGFTLSSGGTLITANATGVPGSITDLTTNYSSAANYEFQGAATGTFTTAPTALTVNNLAFNRSAGVTMSQAFTTNGTLSLKSGSVDLNTLALTVSNGNAAQSITGNAGNTFNINGTGGGTLALTGTAATHVITLSNFGTAGSANLVTGATVNVQMGTNAQLDCAGNGTSTSMLTVLGTMTMNSGTASNIANVHSPIYGSASTLIYNVAYNRFNEWNATGVGTIGSTPGYPNNVTVTTGILTIVNSDAGTARAMKGNLQVNTGCTFTTGALNAIFTVGGTATTTGTGAINLSTTTSKMDVAGTVTNGGSLTLASGGTGGGDRSVGGNLVNNGTFTHNGRAVFFTGTSQTVTGTFNATGATNDFAYVSINNGTNVQLGVAAVVTTDITFNSGKITLGAFDLTLNTGATITTPTISNYIVTNSTGQLKQVVAGSAIAYPVGNSSYDPITLTNSGTSDTYGIIVVDGAVPNTNVAAKAVNRKWQVTEATAGGSNLTPVVLQYNTGEPGASYNAGTTPYMGFYDATAWTQVPTTLAGSNPFTATSTGSGQFPATIPAGSYFAVGKDDAFGSGLKDYYRTTAPGNWSTVGIWQSSPDSSNWFTATKAPGTGSKVNIAHAVTFDVSGTIIPAAVTVNSGVTLTLSNNGMLGSTATTFVTVNGTLNAPATISSAANGLNAQVIVITGTGTFQNSAGIATAIVASQFYVNNGGTYNHDAVGSGVNGATTDFPGTTWTMGASSNVNITNWGVAGQGTVPAIPAIAYGNLTMNIGINLGGSIQMAGTLTSIQGDLKIQKMGSGTARSFSLASSQSYTLTVGGNINVTGGILTLTTTSGTATVNVSGGLSVTAGKFDGSTSGAGNNLNFTTGGLGGDINSTVTTANFVLPNITVNIGRTCNVINTTNASTTKTFTVNGTTNIAPGAMVSGAGTFALTSATTATLGIGSTAGITSSGATGNVQTTTRNFGVLANYIYNGTAPQGMGNGMPASVNTLTIINTGGTGNNTVTDNNAALTVSAVSTSSLTLTSGLLSVGTGKDISIISGGGVNASSGDFDATTIANSGSITFLGTGTVTGTVHFYPGLALNLGTSFSTASTIQNYLQLNSGSFEIGRASCRERV